jgi:hypothetical protein
VETDYPFDETIRMTVHVPSPTQFPIHLRIPAWAKGATIAAGGIPDRDASKDAEPGTFATVERTWADGDSIELTLPMAVETERRYHDSVTIKRGPLVYSLKIGERWEKIRGDEPHADYAVHPTTPWNYGLQIDPENPQVEVIKNTVGDVVYGPDTAPIEIRVKGRRIPEWGLEANSAGPLPQSPVYSTEPLEELTLVPYGCAKLRITEFPLVAE